jgi:hypothetical protein
MKNRAPSANLDVVETASVRPVIVLVTGPLSLFRTTGIYCLRELLLSYDVVLVGWEDYAGDRSFETARTWGGIREVRLLPPAWVPRAYHRAAVALAKDVATRLKPVALLQHNDCYPHNLYLIRAVTGAGGVLRATYAAGFTLDHHQGYAHVRAEEIARMAQRWRVPRRLALIGFRIRSALNHLVRFALLPVLTREWPLRANLNLDTGRVIRRDTAKATDLHLMYSEREREHYRRVLAPGAIEIIRHPVSVVGDEVNRALGMPPAVPRIAFLPTNALISTLSRRAGEDAAIRAMGDTWARALTILRERLGAVPIVAKLHPGAADDPRMIAVMRRVQAEIPEVEILDPADSAERIILGSNCVVGDVSSVLWWTCMVGGRTVVSVDAWGLDAGDEFRHFPGVVYVREPDELRHAVLRSPAERTDDGRPTLSQVLALALGRCRRASSRAA